MPSLERQYQYIHIMYKPKKNIYSLYATLKLNTKQVFIDRQFTYYIKKIKNIYVYK